MSEPPISVNAKGAVVLGRDICCDGFVYNVLARVQTHVHADHMRDFSTSKGTQDIYMTKATRDLLIAEYEADLPHRINVIPKEYNTPFLVNDSWVELVPNGHMLGSAQVCVTSTDGFRLGYSSDFKWPLDRAIEVDALVVDSTYGSAEHMRKYDQGLVDEHFLELVMTQLSKGPVVVQSHRGTSARAASVLFGDVNVPVLATNRVAKEFQVYRAHGSPIGQFVRTESQAGRQVAESGRYVKFVRKGERFDDACTVITLTAQAGSLRDPVVQYSERAFEVAMTEHADFYGTLEYVQATKAKYVITDNSRGGKAVELAMEIQSRLGISARPSTSHFTRAWGV